MDIATGILDSVVERWGCVDDLVNNTHGDKIDRSQAEQFIEQYLKDHHVPGKVQIRWVMRLNSGGKLQEYGQRGNPTGRKLRLWINSGFAGTAYSTSIRAFAHHEICTHAVRNINDHSQVGTSEQESSLSWEVSTSLELPTKPICCPRRSTVMYVCSVHGANVNHIER